jgi:fructan beta-fructosidase
VGVDLRAATHLTREFAAAERGSHLESRIFMTGMHMSKKNKSLLSIAFVLAVNLTSVSGNAESDYTETFRPQYHFTPPQNFMNDPNGLVYYKGEYHLFYQHNPFGDSWGHMSWGHAVSTDLVHWKHLPIALREEDQIMIFSGSAVVDWKNSSGFCRNSDPTDKSCLLAFYTGHGKGKQTQNIAYSIDSGRTWTKYSGNPVIDINSNGFRDPKVFWHEPTRKWIMVTVLAGERKVRFYGSCDLKKWNVLSDFGPAGATGGAWECPDLFQLKIDKAQNESKWVLIVNINPGGVAGGSAGQYFVGQFDGIRFVNDNPDSQQLWVDFGKDFYAAVSWSDIPSSDGRRLWLGWMNNWQYANQVPTYPWRGAQSIPRVLTLKKCPEGIRLVQNPVIEMQKLRDRHYQVEKENIVGDSKLLPADVTDVTADTLEILAEFQLASASELGFIVRKGPAEETLIGYDAKKERIFVDRTHSGNVSFSDDFPGRHTGRLVPQNGEVRFHIFIDRSSVEVFGNDGQTVLTDLIFPDPKSRGIQLYSRNGEVRLVSLDIWQLRAAW